MTDLPLPAYVPLPEPDGYFKNGSAAFWAEPNMHAYAAAKTAAIEAECARLREALEPYADPRAWDEAKGTEWNMTFIPLDRRLEHGWVAAARALLKKPDAALRGKETP